MKLGTAPAPLWKFYRKTQPHSCYICAEGPGPSRPMLALWQFHLSELLWSVDSAGFWGFFCVCPRPPPHSFPIFRRIAQAPPNVWLWVTASASISSWLKPLRGQLCWAPICKYSKIALFWVVSSLSCHGPQVRLVIAWAFPQILLCLLSLHIL